jgi:hypothetical protein
LNDDLIALLGQFSAELLGDERFKMLVQMYQQQCAADFLETKSTQRDQREKIHAAYTGFGDFIALVEKFAEAHKKLIDEQSTDTQALSSDEDDPSVHDIYGVD